MAGSVPALDPSGARFSSPTVCSGLGVVPPSEPPFLTHAERESQRGKTPRCHSPRGFGGSAARGLLWLCRARPCRSLGISSTKKNPHNCPDFPNLGQDGLIYVPSHQQGKNSDDGGSVTLMNLDFPPPDLQQSREPRDKTHQKKPFTNPKRHPMFCFLSFFPLPALLALSGH